MNHPNKNRLLTALLSPSLLWLALLPLMLGEDMSAGGMRGHLLSAVLLLLFVVLQSTLRINYRSLYALLPLLLLIPLHHILIERIDALSSYSMPILALLILGAALWGIKSVRSCQLTAHPTCRELLFTNRLMAYMMLPTVALLFATQLSANILPVLMITVWLLHLVRIVRQQQQEAPPQPLQGREIECHCPYQIRLAIVRGQEVYLAPRTEDGLFDTPFVTCLIKGEERDTALARLQSELPGAIRPRFLLRYTSDTNYGGHEVYLYVANLSPKKEYPSLVREGGFYEAAQLNELKRTHRCTTACVEEYAYLRHTVLLANSIIHRK